ncbi:thioredoxin O1, mitochondrial isoform X2 [Lotus japonicus]|uniref:thioredoxin O1, mitochondrial isoform X2 n=1 Tax=Lotus japonicus TaxID=34305 RepID=UPI002582B54A|nr:thioredoxin O1, mitochondrial isoform X2 [Lotus japonicus]
MSRNLILRSFALRHAIRNAVRPFLNRTHLPSSLSNSKTTSLFAATIASTLLPPFHHSRSLCSAPANPGVVLVNSEEEFNRILTKIQGKFISPIVGELSKKYPHVTTYKIDIDQEALRGTLTKLQISSVPTLHFFLNGKKADELVGADVAKLNRITEKLFKKD